MMDDMGMDDVLLCVVLEDIKERRRTRKAAEKGEDVVYVAKTPTKANASVKKNRVALKGFRSSARLEACGILKRGSLAAISFCDPTVVDLDLSSSTSSPRDDELNEAMMLEELYFDDGLDGPDN
ncbi:hypothetical protein AMTRI_Chr09g39840 [Amborella trichopoda]